MIKQNYFNIEKINKISPTIHFINKNNEKREVPLYYFSSCIQFDQNNELDAEEIYNLIRESLFNSIKEHFFSYSPLWKYNRDETQLFMSEIQYRVGDLFVEGGVYAGAYIVKN